jgi:hypothetical protein
MTLDSQGHGGVFVEGRRWCVPAILAVAAAAATASLALSVPGAGAAVTRTFSSASNAGATGTFVVPEGISSIHVDAVGAKGGDDPGKEDALTITFPSRTGGYGALVSANLPVVPGEALYVYVGGNGASADASGSSAAGGANGGGGTGSAVKAGGGAGGGGGGSDVRMIAAPGSGSQTASLHSRLLVAAGGGGSSDASNAGTPADGNGGTAGQPGPSSFSGAAAQPGTANPDGTGAGGAGGTGGSDPGKAGVLGEGGAAGSDGTYQGGGGGAGLYGGGGGSSFYGQPGAGGSSWVELSASNISPTQIDKTGEPRVTISYEPPAPATISPVIPPMSAPTQPPAGSASAKVITFALSGAPRELGDGSLEFTLLATGPGSFTGSAAATLPAGKAGAAARHKGPRKRTVLYGSGRAKATGSGVVDLRIKPTAAGAKALKQNKRLSLKVTISFQPTTGPAVVKTTGANVKATHGKKKKGH